MPVQVQRVLETVAGTLSGGRRGTMDFTVPEALLLVEQVASRSRDILRRHVPFSDRLPVSWALWAMRNKDRARWAIKASSVGWRVFKAWTNPTQAAIQELGGLAQGTAVDALSDQFQREVRGLLLEEVAHAAVQLYSGDFGSLTRSCCRSSWNRRGVIGRARLRRMNRSACWS